jgi:hypothetical protein
MTEKTMQEKYKLLKEPLKAQDIELRVGTVGEKGVTLLLYKTARVDLKRLDDVFNLRWQRHHYIDGKGNIVCKISIYDTDFKEWISREDVGTESNTEKEKGAYSDSFKRAASSWGIGVELYNSPFIFVKCETVGKGEKSQYGKYKSYELKEKFYFNDVIVTKFEAINSEVFVEIKKKNDVLFSNFNSYTQLNVVEKKQEPQKQIEVFNYEKLKEELMECGTVAEVSIVREKATANKSKMSTEQQKEFGVLLINTINQIQQTENAK